MASSGTLAAVSYTHLDVYKRQAGGNERQAAARPGPRFGGFAQVSLPKKAGEKAKLQEHFTKI